MNDNIREKLYSFIDEIDNSDIVKNMTKYKEKIRSNADVNKLIDVFNEKKELGIDIYDSKVQLYGNELVSSYLKYEQQINYIIMDLNKDLNKLISKRGCIK